MSHINLLPWREHQREKQKQRYLVILACVALGSLGLMQGVGMFVDQLIANQNYRNQYMQRQIAVLDVRIAKIKDIRESKQALEQRIALIEQLQASRNIAPQIIDELVKLVPNGIAFRHLNRRNNQLQIEGISESNNRLSEFMRRIAHSPVFIEAELSSIVAGVTENETGSNFKLTFLISPAVAAESKPPNQVPGQNQNQAQRKGSP